jgi:hypothetical protein
MRKQEKMTDGAKTLWVVAAALGAGLGLHFLTERVVDLRDPTATEKSQMDHTLRPATVGAARAVLRLYTENPSSGYISKPSNLIPSPRNAVDLVVVGKTYTFEVSLQSKKVEGRTELDPKTVYDLNIFKGINPDALTVSAIDTNDDTVDPQLLFAVTPDGKIGADLMLQVHRGEVKDELIDAKEIAKFVREETALFEKQGTKIPYVN